MKYVIILLISMVFIAGCRSISLDATIDVSATREIVISLPSNMKVLHARILQGKPGNITGTDTFWRIDCDKFETTKIVVGELPSSCTQIFDKELKPGRYEYIVDTTTTKVFGEFDLPE